MNGPEARRIWHFIQHNKAFLGLALGLFVIIVVGSLWYAVTGAGRKSQGVFTLPGEATSTEAATSTGMLPRQLDGVMVASGTEALQAFAVMIDGHGDARPTSGLSEANLVFNVPVEGGITRYMAMYDASNTADMIGPVRSAREYFVELAEGMHAVYGHVGGSPQALETIKGISDFRDLNEYYNGSTYWRSAKRAAPHNAYTRMDLLNKAFSAKAWKIMSPAAWSYKEEEAQDATGSERGTDPGPSLAYQYGYAVNWAYDKASNTYLRRLGGVRQSDMDGSQISAKNVMVLSMPGNVMDEKGRLAMSTVGRGKAMVYRDGYASEGIWRRKAGEGIRLEGVDGADIFLERGTTWVEIVADASVFDFAHTTSGTSSTP